MAYSGAMPSLARLSRPLMHAAPRLSRHRHRGSRLIRSIRTTWMERVRLLLGRPAKTSIASCRYSPIPVFGRRYSCVPIEWYYDPHGWADRNRIYIDSALDLLEAANPAAARSQRPRQGRHRQHRRRVDDRKSPTPSLDALLVERMGLRRTVRRLPIFGARLWPAAVIGLARAASQAAGSAGGRSCCFLVVELWRAILPA